MAHGKIDTKNIIDLAEKLSAKNEENINKQKIDFIYANELSDEFEAPDELLEGIFVCGDSSVVYGDSNSGKTFFIIDQACSIARGVDWFGRKTEQGTVIYLAAESPSSVCRRLQAYQKYHNV